MYSSQAQNRWLAIAESLKPVLRKSIVKPVCPATVLADSNAFQGWRVDPAGPVEPLYQLALKRGDSFILDFANHLVGQLEFHATFVKDSQDAPTRLQLIFAETPAELAVPFDPYKGLLSRAWLQDETINIDELPQTVRLPRRYAWRYLKITVIDTSPWYQIRFTDIHAIAQTSADPSAVAPLPASTSADLVALDEVSQRTLANCMHTVFEDGPKRDQRLWLGDLRLQLLANYVTFRNYDLAKRCLYLFAGTARESGGVTACIFERPTVYRGHCDILDYAALYGPTLRDYARASGDWETARDLWPVALQQLRIAAKYVNEQGLFIDPGNWWIFIDWESKLHRQTSMHGLLLFCLRESWELAKELNLQDHNDVSFMPPLIEKMTQAARRDLIDAEQQLFFSGPDRQISWASQAWMILAGAVTPPEGRALLTRLMAHPTAVRPAGPYLYHYVAEAMQSCGMRDELRDLLTTYWGGMVKRGATTFWEVFDPNDDFLCPYAQTYVINSYCHAWSCTPSYFIRRFLGEQDELRLHSPKAVDIH